MKRKAHLTWVGLGAFLLMSNSSVLAKNPSGEDRGVTISVYNDAEVAEDTMKEAEEDTTLVFRQAGIAVRWLNCPSTPKTAEGVAKSRACTEAVFPEHLQLRIARQSIGLPGATMGISYLSADGQGCYADLFYEPIEELGKKKHTRLGSILGHVAAHEIGHLLLGTHSHAPHGIMRAVWESGELASVSRGTLFFSGWEAQQMRKRLADSFARHIENTRTATAHMGN